MKSPKELSGGRVPNYRDLQQNIDQVLAKIGLENTIFLLSSFITATHVPVNETHSFRFISRYLISEAMKRSELDEKCFFTSKSREYQQARMSCFHLIKKYTDASHARIADELGITKRNVIYNCSACQEKLSIPFYYPAFVREYDALEKCLILFISKLNNNDDGSFKRSTTGTE